MSLSFSEKVSCLRLIMTDNIGPVTYMQLIDYYGSATEALNHLAELSYRGGGKKKFVSASVSMAEKQFETAQKNDVKIVFKQEYSYPKILRHLSDAPSVLFIKGNETVFNKKGIAVVGTRNASINGKTLAKKIAFDLADAGYQIVSGMAHGIDRSAHMGALSSEKIPSTTAVLGTAIDEIYPLENKDIYEQIAERGCLVSEFPFGSILSPRNFPRRNRIISGLSLGTLVIEAQERSGSLITAVEALNQGREVFAVPGSPADPRSSGPNKLIKDGATLVGCAQDIIDVIENLNQLSLKEIYKKVYKSIPIDETVLTYARQIIWNNLSTDPVSVDALISETGLETRIVNIILMELAIAGRLERHIGNRVSIIYKVE